MTEVFIGLGANLGEPLETLTCAVQMISELGQLQRCSSLYKSAAWGFEDQPDFFNCAVALEFQGTPTELLAHLQKVESRLGRKKTFKWGPRMIDLDIITFGDLEIDSAALKIPHPHYRERSFVLGPLAEIDPRFSDHFRQLGAACFEITRVANAGWEQRKRKVGDCQN